MRERRRWPVLYLSSRHPPVLPPFPYTTLFRSGPGVGVLQPGRGLRGQVGVVGEVPPGQEVALDPLDQRLRSEEHTSELQSHVNLVCRLLLDKKTEPRQSFGAADVAVLRPAAES